MVRFLSLLLASLLYNRVFREDSRLMKNSGNSDFNLKIIRTVKYIRTYQQGGNVVIAGIQSDDFAPKIKPS
jgi:hypothetical protein